MKTALFIVNATDVRWRGQPKAVWFANAVRSVNDLAQKTCIEVPAQSSFDVAAIYEHGARAAVIHYLGNYDDGSVRLLFAVNDLTIRHTILEAARKFNRENNNILNVLRCA